MACSLRSCLAVFLIQCMKAHSGAAGERGSRPVIIIVLTFWSPILAPLGVALGHYYYNNFDNNTYYYLLRAHSGTTGTASEPLLLQYLLLSYLCQGPFWGQRAIIITIIMITTNTNNYFLRAHSGPLGVPVGHNHYSIYYYYTLVRAHSGATGRASGPLLLH